MMKILAALLAFLAVSFAWAETYKCRKPDGTTAYQEMPCGPDAAGNTVGIRTTEARPAPDSERNRKAMREVYEAKMAKRDYDGAVAFATTDRERAAALTMKDKKDVECASLDIKARKARANVRKASDEPAAEAAESEYRVRCK